MEYDAEKGYKESKCQCSTRTKWIICVCITTPFVVLSALFLACVIVQATQEDPFQLMPLTDDEATFMPAEESDKMERANRLASAIAFQTITTDNGVEDKYIEEFVMINEFLTDNFVELHEADFVQFEQINNFSRLYRIPGEKSEEKRAYMLCAHIDVVPPGDEDKWAAHPFNTGVVESVPGFEEYG